MQEIQSSERRVTATWTRIRSHCFQFSPVQYALTILPQFSSYESDSSLIWQTAPLQYGTVGSSWSKNKLLEIILARTVRPSSARSLKQQAVSVPLPSQVWDWLSEGSFLDLLSVRESRSRRVGTCCCILREVYTMGWMGWGFWNVDIEM